MLIMAIVGRMQNFHQMLKVTELPRISSCLLNPVFWNLINSFQSEGTSVQIELCLISYILSNNRNLTVGNLSVFLEH